MNVDPVSTIIAWISAYGFVALFAIAFLERFVPVIPSYGLLLAVGFSASQGTWSLPVAFLVTVIGNTLGAIVCFFLVGWMGEARSMRSLNKMGKVLGVSADGITRWIGTFRRHETLLAFSLQLVPTVRLFAPAFAALLRSRSTNVLLATAAGIMVWNGTFIGVGYVASFWFESVNKTVLALTVLAALLVTEVAFLWLWRSAPSFPTKVLGLKAQSAAPNRSSNSVRETLYEAMYDE